MNPYSIVKDSSLGAYRYYIEVEIIIPYETEDKGNFVLSVWMQKDGKNVTTHRVRHSGYYHIADAVLDGLTIVKEWENNLTAS